MLPLASFAHVFVPVAQTVYVFKQSFVVFKKKKKFCGGISFKWQGTLLSILPACIVVSLVGITLQLTKILGN